MNSVPPGRGSRRPLTLGELRERASQLYDQNHSYADIAAALGITAVKARDCRVQYQRLRRLKPPQAYRMELSRRAIKVLTTGRYSSLGGKALTARLARLPEIAAAYTHRDLLQEADIGRRTVNEIAVWLESKGLALREPGRDVIEAIARAQAAYPERNERKDAMARPRRNPDPGARSPGKGSLDTDSFVSCYLSSLPESASVKLPEGFNPFFSEV